MIPSGSARRALCALSLTSLFGGSIAACGRVGPTAYRAVQDRDASRIIDATPMTPFDVLTNDAMPARDARHVQADATILDATVVDRVPPPRTDGALPPHEAGPSRDAAPDVRDAPAAPDCRCPQGDYYVDADVNGERIRMSSAFRQSLYCDESAAQLAHPPCGSTLRLSGCAGIENGPPCLYLTVDGGTPIIGLFVDRTGQTFELVTGEITLASESGRLATGAFSATYTSRTSDASVSVTGSFHACTVLFQPCKT